MDLASEPELEDGPPELESDGSSEGAGWLDEEQEHGGAGFDFLGGRGFNTGFFGGRTGGHRTPPRAAAGPNVAAAGGGNADFLGGRGFNAGFFGAGPGPGRPPPAPAAAAAGALHPAVEAELSASLRNWQAQLHTLQEQLHDMNDLELDSPGGSDPRQWDSVEDEVEWVMAELEARGLVLGRPAGPGVFGAPRLDSRLLARMLGLGPAYYGGSAERSHEDLMMEIWGPGVPSAVNPDHHAALAAEGVPAGRMERPAQGEAPRAPLNGDFRQLLSMMQLRLGEAMQPLLGDDGAPIGGSGAQQPRGAAQRSGQQLPGGLFWGALGGPPPMWDYGDDEPDSEEDCFSEEEEEEDPVAVIRGRQFLAPSSAPAAAQRAAQQGGEDSDMPSLLSEGETSSGPSLASLGSGRRRRQLRPGAGPGPAGAGGSSSDNEPPLLVPDTGDSGSSASNADNEPWGARGFARGFLGAGAAPAATPQGRGPRRARWAPPVRGSGAEPASAAAETDVLPPLESDTDSDLGSEGSGRRLARHARRASAGPAGSSGAAGAAQAARPRRRVRQRRNAFFGQLPGLTSAEQLELAASQQAPQQRPQRRNAVLGQVPGLAAAAQQELAPGTASDSDSVPALASENESGTELSSSGSSRGGESSREGESSEWETDEGEGSEVEATPAPGSSSSQPGGAGSGSEALRGAPDTLPEAPAVQSAYLRSLPIPQPIPLRAASGPSSGAGGQARPVPQQGLPSGTGARTAGGEPGQTMRTSPHEAARLQGRPAGEQQHTATAPAAAPGPATHSAAEPPEAGAEPVAAAQSAPDSLQRASKQQPAAAVQELSPGGSQQRSRLASHCLEDLEEQPAECDALHEQEEAPGGTRSAAAGAAAPAAAGPSVVGRVLGTGVGLVRWLAGGGRHQGS